VKGKNYESGAETLGLGVEDDAEEHIDGVQTENDITNEEVNEVASIYLIRVILGQTRSHSQSPQ
jgi:hypothetical protein